MIISESGLDLVIVFDHVVILFEHHYSGEVVLFILCLNFILGFQFHFYWIFEVCYLFTWFDVSVILKFLVVYFFFFNLIFLLVKLYYRNSLLLVVQLFINFIEGLWISLCWVEFLILLIKLLIYLNLRYAFKIWI